MNLTLQKGIPARCFYFRFLILLCEIPGTVLQEILHPFYLDFRKH